MRFLYIKVLQILNQMVDLMLRIVGHVPRVSHLAGIFTQLWGDNAIDVPQRKLWGDVSPLSPAGFTPLHVHRKIITNEQYVNTIVLTKLL